MALITPVTLESKGPTTVEAGWSGAGYVSTNGELKAGPETDGADLPHKPDEVIALEVHDAEVDEIHMTPETHPLTRWRTVSGASRYRMYHKGPDDGSFTLALEVVHDDDVDPYEERCPTDCEEGWHAFEVRAVDSANTEASVTTWYIYVFDLPELPSDMEISGSGGSFDIALTE